MITNSAEKLNVDAESILNFQATFLSHDNFEEAATALATELALKLGLDRASIGIIENGQTQVKAISHSADTQAKHETQRRIAAAMDEAIAQAAVIIHPEPSGSQPRLILAHTALARGAGNKLCTIPLTDNGVIFGAITLEHAASSNFKRDEISTLENIASLLGTIIHLKANEGNSWFAHLKSDVAHWKERHLNNADITLKLGLLGLLAFMFALLFIPIQHNISAPARLEGSIQRALVAPEDGFLQHSYVRPGDQVKANQVLAELADQDLLLEKRRWQSEFAQYENAYGASLAQSDRVQMVINQSKAESARSQLILAEEKLLRARIIAPFDGVIIKGDLKQSLGAPVQRGDILLTIAPVAEFRLMVEVDERDISAVKLNQVGKVSLTSLPDKTFSFYVKRITPAASSKEGRNFFEVEGALKTNNLIALRPGLEGVAKISVEKRSSFWILTHRITDWAKLTLWAWGL
jgi:multidrug resistance efflux pump